MCMEKNGLVKNEGEKVIKENLIVDRYKIYLLIRIAMKAFAKAQKAKKKEENKVGLECLGTDGKHDKKTMMVEAVTVNNVEQEKHYQQ